MDRHVVPVTAYEIKGTCSETSIASRAFVFLYTPIIGIDAASLFQHLALSQNKIGTHQYFMQQFNWTISQFLQALSRLEAIHLVQTYYDQSTETYIYVLVEPLGYNQFFQQPLYAGLLKKIVGEATYDQYVPKLVDLSHQNVSHTFADVYGKSDMIEVEMEKQYIDMHTFLDWDVFQQLISKSFVRMKTIEANKEYLLTKAFVYQLSPQLLAQYVLDGYNVKTHEMDYVLLERNLSKVSRAKKLEKMTVKKDGGSKLDMLAQSFEMTHPRDFLKARFGHVSQSDMRVIEMCLTQFQFSYGVTNAILDYTLYANDQRLVRAYVEAICSQLYRKKIVTAKDAMLHFKNIKSQQTNAVKSTVNKGYRATNVRKKSDMVDWENVETKRASISDDKIDALLAQFVEGE